VTNEMINSPELFMFLFATLLAFAAGLFLWDGYGRDNGKELTKGRALGILILICTFHWMLFFFVFFLFAMALQWTSAWLDTPLWKRKK